MGRPSAHGDGLCRHLAVKRLQQARRAATLLQACWRGHAARRAVARQHGAAVAIQSAWRQRQAMRRYARDVRDIICAQASRSGCLAAMEHSERIKWYTVTAWTDLPAWLDATKPPASLKYHSIGYKVRSHPDYLCCIHFICKHAVRQGTTAQAFVRGWLARRTLLRCRGACISMQAHWRAHVARKRVARIRAAVVVQQHARGWRCRRSLAAQHRAATHIQVLPLCNLQTVWISSLDAIQNKGQRDAAPTSEGMAIAGSHESVQVPDQIPASATGSY